MPKRKAAELSADRDQNGITTTFPAKRTRKAADRLIKEANAMTVEDFTSKHFNSNALTYSTINPSANHDFRITHKAAKDLNKQELKACFSLIESTSRRDYEASGWGWYPRRKKREMKEKDMRYLLVRSMRTAKHPDGNVDDRIAGFLSFMLTHDSIPSMPVLYIYEIHLTLSLRKLGLGAHLMDVAEGIAANVGVDKVMLTCLLSNEKAHSYYKRRGYVTDVCSPEDRITRNKVLKSDYVIMSRPVGKG